MNSKKKRFSTRFYLWMSFLLLILILAFFFIRYVNSYLSVSKPTDAQILVVEGWMPDYAIIQGKKEFESRNYNLIITSGIPFLKGANLTEFASEADLAEAVLTMLGMNPDVIASAPAPFTMKDRTYASALAVKRFIATLKYPVWGINIITFGSHSRRSRLLYRKALGKNIKVGTIAVEDKSYDPHRWWKYSNGVRAIMDESIALTYAALLFRPDESDEHPDVIIQDQLKEVLDYRTELNEIYRDPEHTPLNDDQLRIFSGLKWFPVNIEYRLNGIYIPSDTRDTMIFKTSTDRMPSYVKTGKVRFTLFGETCELSTFLNAERANDTASSHILFCPFTDLTCGNTTYGGGRYLDLEVPEGQYLVIDFNKSYHPYCAYNHKWSCVIPPPENHLPMAIYAGIRL